MGSPYSEPGSQPEQQPQPRPRWQLVMLVVITVIAVSLTLALSYVTAGFLLNWQADSAEQTDVPTEVNVCQEAYLFLGGERLPIAELPSFSGLPSDLLSAEQGFVYQLYSQNGRYTYGLLYPPELKPLIDSLDVGAAAFLLRADCSLEDLSLISLEHLLLGGLSGRHGEPAGAVLFVLADPAIQIDEDELPVDPVLWTVTPTPTLTPTPTVTHTPTTTLTPSLTPTFTPSPELTETETATPSETSTDTSTPTETATNQTTTPIP
jgi:hypothetical protein